MTHKPLAGKTILMSGGSRGIGLAIALRAAADGANVALLAKTDTPHPKLEGTVHSAAEQIRAAGGNALPIVGDVRNDDDITEAVMKTQGEFGGIDIVINNASVIDLSRSLDLPAKKYDLMQDVNVRGTFLLSRAPSRSSGTARTRTSSALSAAQPRPEVARRTHGLHPREVRDDDGDPGLAAEFADDGIAANTLWPRTTIATAAVQNLLGGDRVMAASRTPEIYADAAYEVLVKPARDTPGRPSSSRTCWRMSESPTSRATRPCPARPMTGCSRTSSCAASAQPREEHRLDAFVLLHALGLDVALALVEPAGWPRCSEPVNTSASAASVRASSAGAAASDPIPRPCMSGAMASRPISSRFAVSLGAHRADHPGARRGRRIPGW